MTEGNGTRPSIFKRKFIIIPDFQWALITQAIIVVVIYYFLSRVIDYYVLNEFFMSPDYDQLPKEEIMSDLKSRLVIISTLKFFVMLAILSAWGVWFSHRAAGPIYRMQKILEELNNDSTPGTVFIRNKDYFQGMFKELRAFLEKNNFIK